jgi:Prophage CP4-57 regulatory protein (AlpA)
VLLGAGDKVSKNTEKFRLAFNQISLSEPIAQGRQPYYVQSRPFFIAQGTFPTPLRLGGSAIGWLQAEVQQWLQRRIDTSQ